MKIGLFGGSFDPVHIAHLLVAQAAMEELGLERLHFIPAAQSPFKPDSKPTSAPIRIQMLRLALAGDTKYEVDEQETNRGGISYTIDTLRDYQRRYPGAGLFYLIGADHVASLPDWRGAEELARLAEFVAIPRPAWSSCESPAKAAGSSVVLNFPAPFRGRMLKGIPFGVSSSGIRARVKAGLAIHHLVPAGVDEAIRNNHLYL